MEKYTQLAEKIGKIFLAHFSKKKLTFGVFSQKVTPKFNQNHAKMLMCKDFWSKSAQKSPEWHVFQEKKMLEFIFARFFS